ncbi:hypothetical protein MBANPS3_007035 [Mucor bainieri]
MFGLIRSSCLQNIQNDKVNKELWDTTAKEIYGEHLKKAALEARLQNTTREVIGKTAEEVFGLASEKVQKENSPRKDNENWEKEAIHEQMKKCEVAFMTFLKEEYMEEERLQRGQPSSSSMAASNSIIAEPQQSSSSITYIKVKGLNKRKIAKESEGNNMKGNEDVKRRKLMEEHELLKDCSAFVRKKVMNNNEMQQYLQQDDTSSQELLGVSYVNSIDEERKASIEYKTGLDFAHQPLQFWSQQRNKFPYLSLFAAKYLAVCSSSVASERFFSQAKGFINKERARLDTEMGERLVLMNAWLREQEEKNIYSKK